MVTYHPGLLYWPSEGGFHALCPACPGQAFPRCCGISIAICCLLCKGNLSTPYQPIIWGLLFSLLKVWVAVQWRFHWKITVEGIFIIVPRVRKMMMILWPVYLIPKLNGMHRQWWRGAQEKPLYPFQAPQFKVAYNLLTCNLCFGEP